jgi:2-iminobutanoate/2-iminopropanoate deaminase
LKKKALYSSNYPKPRRPLSQAIQAGNFVFVSGTAALEPGTYNIIGETVAHQTTYTLNSILNLLKEVGADEQNVVKVNAYITDKSSFNEFNEAYEKFFTDPKPARTTVVSNLVGPFLVEIDCIAYVPDEMN